MRFISTLIALMTISAAAHSLTLDAGKFSGTLTEVVVVGDCGEDSCNYKLQTLSSVSLKEATSVKTAELSTLKLNATTSTKWNKDATILDVAGSQLSVDLKKIPQAVNPGAMAPAKLSVIVRDGNSMGVSTRNYEATCTLISSKQLSCIAYNVSDDGHQLRIQLQAL